MSSTTEAEEEDEWISTAKDNDKAQQELIQFYSIHEKLFIDWSLYCALTRTYTDESHLSLPLSPSHSVPDI